MSTTVVKTATSRTPPTAAPSGRQAARRLPLAVAVLAITLTAVGVGTWLIVGRVGGSGGSALSTPATAPAWTPIATTWLERLRVVGLKRQLARAGYSVEVDGNLDPVAKSALADYLQPAGARPLAASLAVALEGTVITGVRDPAAWNKRFGLHSLTRFVHQPFSGAGEQLDAKGNLLSRSR
jgi:hypothetical protein